MNQDWERFLRASGVPVAGDRVDHLSPATTELAAAQQGPVLLDLSDQGLLEFTNVDAESFLQNQLSNDIAALDAHSWQYAAYCSAKGRMLASLLLWRAVGGFRAQLPRTLRESTRQRLGKFVLRARVQIEDHTDTTVALGVAGPGAAELIESVLGSVPAATMGKLERSGACLLRLNSERFQLLCAASVAQDLWHDLGKQARVVGTAVWDWLLVHEGIPVITLATQDQLVPQMANFEAIGGVSFHKGCYPGQEIVARTQHLGRIKRRTYLAHVDSSSAPRSGDALYSLDLPGQSTGIVLNVAPALPTGHDLLATIQVESAARSEVHWGTPDGPSLRFSPLPYTVT
jgi:folate-binding protein YgfZ